LIAIRTYELSGCVDLTGKRKRSVRVRGGLKAGLIIAATFSGPAFALSQQTQSDPVAGLRAGLELIASRHHLGRVWLYVEQNRTAIANMGIRGANPDAPHPVGSLSKSITGIGIALLVQDGKLSLNSTIGDVLGRQYAEHKRPMDDNLKQVTIERLLTHTAGLRPNKITDPVNGIASDDVLRQLGARPTAFDFLNASNADHSTGRATFLYSNVSYLMLGLVIEAISGQSYEDFCRSRILQPLQISDAALLGGRYRAISAYSGWILTRRDIATVWRSVFDTRHPSILRRETLENILLAPLGQLVGKNRDARYVMGTIVRQGADHSTYRINHNGVQGTRLLGTGDRSEYLSYMEDTVPGPIWSFATTPEPQQQDWQAIYGDVRKLVETQIQD
jgi:D-alanyl-D-alanine carboxypeptidase